MDRGRGEEFDGEVCVGMEVCEGDERAAEDEEGHKGQSEGGQ